MTYLRALIFGQLTDEQASATENFALAVFIGSVLVVALFRSWLP